MRKVLSDLFNKQSDFEVAGTAINGRDAIDKVKKLKPDVLTLDVNMPVMDGLEALAVIMEECPLPVVMFSSLTQRGTDATIRALALGAVDWISKAGGPISKIDPVQNEILTKCREAVQAHVGSSKSFSSSRPLTYTPVFGIKSIVKSLVNTDVKAMTPLAPLNLSAALPRDIRRKRRLPQQ